MSVSCSNAGDEVQGGGYVLTGASVTANPLPSPVEDIATGAGTWTVSFAQAETFNVVIECGTPGGVIIPF
ncbi:MAG TPA: hypothetical protein VGL48_09155 [Acidimicrobiales bacterium]